MVKPIHQLRKIIKEQEIATLGQKNDVERYHSYAELSELYDDYHDMSDKLNQSMNELFDLKQQELNASLKALQSQTNPHFYYNTLSNIIVLSENNQNSEVIQLCHNLTQIMRYFTDNSVARVPVKEELKYVEKYLYCMKVRYQESLVFTFDVDSVLSNIMIPKLSLQTLVENAVKYGTDCIPPWKITISGGADQTGWYIIIEDNGKGFSDRSLSKIRERIDTINQTSGLQELKIDGFGLMNVYIRLKYMFVDRLIFEYGNTEKNHGFVKIGCRSTHKGMGDEL
ncbi:MAG: histidine kinase [Spirochaetales bacterium]|nr:histidine kinase [Spirochaetales bacterium]